MLSRSACQEPLEIVGFLFPQAQQMQVGKWSKSRQCQEKQSSDDAALPRTEQKFVLLLSKERDASFKVNQCFALLDPRRGFSAQNAKTKRPDDSMRCDRSLTLGV